jgi:hypothetical protein
MTVEEILKAASEHAERLAEDILLCSTRMEHVRVTARANEASLILASLQKFFSEEAASGGDI